MYYHWDFCFNVIDDQMETKICVYRDFSLSLYAIFIVRMVARQFIYP